MTFPLAVSRVRRALSTEQTELILYVRNDGNDNNSGLTELQALRTLQEAISRLDSETVGLHRQVINLTGFTADIDTPIHIETPVAIQGANNLSRTGGLDGIKGDVFNFAFEMLADPVEVQTVTVTGQSVDATTGHKTLTVSDTLTPDAHIGQSLEGGFFVKGVVHSNTENEIVISGQNVGSSFSATSRLWTQSCVLTCSIASALIISARGPVGISGIKTVQTGASSSKTISIRNYSNRVYIQYCNIHGLGVPKENGSTGFISVWDSYLTGGWWVEGCIHEFQSSVLHGVQFAVHGSGGYGQNAVADCILDGCGSYGGANWEEAVDFEIGTSWFVNGTGNAIYIGTPFKARISNTRIDDCAGSAIVVDCPAVVKVTNVAGTGNGGWGLNLLNGAQADVTTSSTVSGTSGQISLGGLGSSFFTDAPATDIAADNPQFCRIF